MHTQGYKEGYKMMRTYEFTFENGSKYTGTAEDKQFFVRHLTRSEKAEMGKIVSKRVLTDGEVKAYNDKVERFLAWV